MGIEIEEIITLDDKKQYVVVSKVNYENSNYIYIVDIHDTSNIKFAEVENSNGKIIISEISSSEQELLDKILPMFFKQNEQLFNQE